MFNSQWKKLITAEEKEGLEFALALIYQWAKTNVISQSDFIKMTKYCFAPNNFD